MPQKVYNGLDYDSGCDVCDDYYDYGDNNKTEGEGRTSKLDKLASKPGFWQCSVCAHDNDESFSFCDVCGVFHDSTNIFGGEVEEKAHGMCKDSEASIMAKSLFAQSPSSRSHKATISDGILKEDSSKSYDTGCIPARFHDLQKTFVVPQRGRYINIDSFKFDSPSPDDLVLLGKNSSKTAVKVDSLPSASKKTTSSIVGKKGKVNLSPNNEVSDNATPALTKANHLNESESSNATLDEDAEQILSKDIHDMKLNKNSRNHKDRTATNVQYKPEKWMFPEQEQGILNQLNLAIVGHVDSGKSTLCGRLLHLLGRISKKQMHKFEKEAKEKGKGSFAYAWAMDESADERERGLTMTVAVAYFDTTKYRVVLLDSPGHKDFVPKMISGATQADAAILVVDAAVGSFEAGMGGNGVGQTKEHAQLIRSFGVEQIIIAVNKMDLVEFSKERFDFIKLQLGLFLRSCGFKGSSVTWIPISTMENQNLITAAYDARLSSWYQGYCLLDAINSLQPPHRDVSKPPLLPVCDVITSRSLGLVAVCGKLEAGAIRNGSKVLVMPSGDLATVRTIERDSTICSIARAGDNVAIGLQGIDACHVIPGSVLCHSDFPVTVASSLELKVLILDVTTPILIGSQVELHIYHAKEAARVVKILSLLDQKTGNVSKRAPRILTARQSAVIEVALDGPMCVEEFSSCRALGRAFLRASGSTVAVGIVTRVIEHES